MADWDLLTRLALCIAARLHSENVTKQLSVIVQSGRRSHGRGGECG